MSSELPILEDKNTRDYAIERMRRQRIEQELEAAAKRREERERQKQAEAAEAPAQAQSQPSEPDKQEKSESSGLPGNAPGVMSLLIPHPTGMEDLANSLVPYPSQIAGAALDVVQELPQALGDTAKGIGDLLHIPEGGIVVGPDGIRFARGSEYTEASVFNQLTEKIEELVPDIEHREDGGGEMARSIAKFGIGFALARKLPGIKELEKVGKAGQYTAAALRGAAADFAVFDPQEDRLSNLIQSFPSLENPVTEFLAADPDDPAVVGRLKASIEGLGLGAITDTLVGGVRALARARRARGALEAAAQRMDEFELLEETTKTQKTRFHELLGDPERPLFDITSSEITDEQAARALAEGAKRGSERAAKAVPRGTKGEEGADIMVNWARINTDDDVKAVMQDMADAFSGGIDEAKRGTRSFQQIQLDAGELDAWEILRNRPHGQPLSAEQSVAARELWGRSSRKTLELANAVTADPSEVNQMAFRKMLAVHNAIQEQVLAARTETARALSSWRIPAGDTVAFSTQMDDLRTLIHGENSTLKIAKDLRQLHATGRIDAANAYIYGTTWAKTRDAVTQLWYGSLLSGPHTHMRNLISNTSVLPLKLAERRVGAALSAAFGDAEIPTAETGSLLHGMLQGFRESFRVSAKAMKYLAMDALENPSGARQYIEENADEFGGFWRSLATGESGFGIGKVDERALGAFSPEKWRMAEDNPWSAVMTFIDSVTTMPTRALAAGDEIFKTMNFRGELNALATRQAYQEVRNGAITAGEMADRVTELVNNPSESMRLMATREAQVATFTQAPPVDGRAWRATRAWSKIPIIGRITLPFTRTPYNIANFTFRRTPLAPLMQSYQDAFNKGGAEAAMANAQMLTGSALLATFAELAMQNRITGDGPANPKERETLQRTGWKPNSVFLGDPEDGGYYISYRGLEPISGLIGLAANTVEILGADDFENEDAELQDLVTATSLAIGDQLISANYMIGVSRFIDALSDPKRRGEAFFEGLAAPLIPTGVATIARAKDSVIREVNGMADAIRNRMPGLSKDLPARRDVFGRELTRTSGVGKAYDILSPMYASASDPQPIDKELLEQEVFIGTPNHKVSFDGIRVNLDLFKGSYSRYLELSGEITEGRFGEPITAGWWQNDGGTLLEELNGLVTGKGKYAAEYETLSKGADGARAKLIRGIVSAYQDAARDALLDETPELRIEVNRRRSRLPGTYEGIDLPRLEFGQ